MVSPKCMCLYHYTYMIHHTQCKKTETRFKFETRELVEPLGVAFRSVFMMGGKKKLLIVVIYIRYTEKYNCFSLPIWISKVTFHSQR